MTIATEMRLSTQNQFFFFSFFVFFGWKKSTLTILEKVADQDFFDFWPFKIEKKFRKSVKLAEKFEIWQKVNIFHPDTSKLGHCILRVLFAI